MISHRSFASAGILVALAFAAGPVLAQTPCGPAWADGFGPTGAENRVYAAIQYTDASGPNLVIGGSFTAVSSVAAAHVARFNGTSWSAIGGGIDGDVYCLAVHDDGGGPALYAGGNIPLSGVVQGVRRWNGSSWSAPGGGMSGQVTSLVTFDDGTGPALYAGGFFNFAGGMPATNVARWNGSSWSPLGNGIAAGVTRLRVYDSGIGGPGLMAGAQSGLWRWNGATWTQVAPIANSAQTVFGNYPAINELIVGDDGNGVALFIGGRFTSINGLLANSIARYNGLAFTALGAGPGSTTSPGTANVRALLIENLGPGLRLYAGGGFSNAGGVSGQSNLAEWDGSTRASLGPGALNGGGVSGGGVEALTVVNDAQGLGIVAAGSFQQAGPFVSPNIARWDGTTWASIAAGNGLLGDGLALAVYDDGMGSKLYAGGSFTIAGSLNSGGFARFDGTTWDTVTGQVFQGQVTALAVLHELSGPALYIGATIPGFSPGIARMAGNAVTSVSSGLTYVGPSTNPGSAFVMKEVVDANGPSLIVGGSFTHAGGVPCARIARWNGTSFSPLGTGVDSSVLAVAAFDAGMGAEIYAGGTFTSAGGLPVSGVARWNGTSWNSVGAGLAPCGSTCAPVDDLVTFDDGSGPALYATGAFSGAVGVPGTQGIARWNGTSWSSVGGGITGFGPAALRLWSLGVFDDGRGAALYCMGPFSTAGGVAAERIARWNGTQWEGLGTGLGDAVTNSFFSALATYDDGSGPALFATGRFGRSGPFGCKNIARWNAQRPGLSVAAGAGGLSLTNAGLVPGHEYFNVFSFETCGSGPGSGPYLGLCASNPAPLVAQVTLPIGVVPFHYLASGNRATFGPYLLPPGTTLDAISIEVSSGAILCTSSVRRIVAP